MTVFPVRAWDEMIGGIKKGRANLIFFFRRFCKLTIEQIRISADKRHV